MEHPNAPDPVPCPIDHLTCRGAPEAVALVLRDRALTYAQLDRRVGQLAGYLAGATQPGDRIASWAGKGELSCLLPLAAPRAGLIHVPANPLLKRAQVAHILADSKATMLLANEARLSTLVSEDAPAGCRLRSTEEVVAALDHQPTELAASKADPRSLAAILYTSGSAGRPKGVMLSHANLWLGAVSVAHYLELADDDVTLAVLPLSFDYGQNQLFSTWYAGGRAVPLDYLTARDVVKACAAHGVTTLAAVPPLWHQLTEAAWPKAATRHLRRLTNSGGSLDRPLIAAMQRCFPSVDIVAMYGLTEAFRSTFLPAELLATHPTSIGSAIPFAEVLVVDDAGDPAGAGEEGELVHCGPLVAQGYWNDAARTAERFRPAPPWSTYGGTAVWSGDRVTADGDGLLYFQGRRDAMIKSMGHRISPHEIETAAVESSLVAEAAVLGVEDANRGQAIHLFVRAADNRAGDPEALRSHLASLLPSFMQPQAIHWREHLPRNVNGKIDRQALAAEIAGEAVR